MKIFTVLFFVISWDGAFAQFKPKHAIVKYEIPSVIEPKSSAPSAFGLLSDKPQTYNYQTPALTSIPGNTFNQSSSFWINNVSSQSYNNGRFGTYYYWDIQGNLRGTRGFIDLSGKNRRGVKLLFPWR